VQGFISVENTPDSNLELSVIPFMWTGDVDFVSLIEAIDTTTIAKIRAIGFVQHYIVYAK
jgi:hypothetical protein